ncbi:MAG: sensor histidine kinase [Gemmatimonadota bacterium]|nr:sensor histidine kinase [Gemmatimonadota bacterium]
MALALARRGHIARQVALDGALAAIDDATDAVVIAGSRADAMALGAHIKTRYQVPLLPVIALHPERVRASHESAAPDVWLPITTPPSAIIGRIEELARIRRAEREFVRLNGSLVELAAENGRLYERARRDAEATTVLLRELQHRVRNNLASIQALLVLERHRRPERPLSEAIDVAITRLRTMAAIQDALQLDAAVVEMRGLTGSIARSVQEVFSAADTLRVEIRGQASVRTSQGSAAAVVINELVTNVVKHACASRLDITIERTDNAVSVTIADDGRGIPATHVPGSGLAIARTVTRNELHGELTSEAIPKGARFRLSFPVDAA